MAKLDELRFDNTYARLPPAFYSKLAPTPLAGPHLVSFNPAAAGFDSAEDVEDWLRARCFKAAGAKALDDAGLTPEQAAIRTREGASDYEDTIGFKVSNGDLSTDAARRLATNSFWNT